MFRFKHRDHKTRDYIESQLKKLVNVKDKETLLTTLKEFHSINATKRSYTGHHTTLSLKALREFKTEDICSIFSKIASYILSSSDNKIELLYSQKPQETNLKKSDVLLMMCLMSTFLVPTQDYEEDKWRERSFNHLKTFEYIFSNEEQKTLSIIKYFKEEFKKQELNSCFTLRRIVTKGSLEDLLHIHGNLKMSRVSIESDDSDIEDYNGTLKVDFSNKYIGGGSLTHGCVQEEMMFAVHPEMYTSMILCQMLQDNEALVFFGYRRYFNYTGYNQSFKLTGINDQKYGWDQKGRVKEYITAIDAFNFNREHIDQYSPLAVQREILKAYTGFNVAEVRQIASGNWGCGVFGGNLQLKFLIQWIAASMAEKTLLYCPFGKSKNLPPQKFLDSLSSYSVNDIYSILFNVLKMKKKYQEERNILKEMYEFIQTHKK